MSTDILRVTATETDGAISFSFLDERMSHIDIITVDGEITDPIQSGDIWHVSLVSSTDKSRDESGTATIRLIARERKGATWEKISELEGFWTLPGQLKIMLAWLHAGQDFLLMGPKGTGKTTIARAICDTLGWQAPCKIEVPSVKSVADLFGMNAAENGSTVFQKSRLFIYIERAIAAYEAGIDTHFLVVLDEINRVHAKASEAWHSLFDDSRQISLVTVAGSKLVRLPPNLHIVGTMNVGRQYVGTFPLDEAMKDRLPAIQLPQMPKSVEVKFLRERVPHVPKHHADAIVDVANKLRETAENGQVSFSPSFRGSVATAELCVAGVSLKEAIKAGMMGHYLKQGDDETTGEFGIALSAVNSLVGV
jgi:MoxR-like ATPase